MIWITATDLATLLECIHTNRKGLKDMALRQRNIRSNYIATELGRRGIGRYVCVDLGNGWLELRLQNRCICARSIPGLIARV